ncbi:Phosphatidylethanolamine-binding protein 4 [Pseudocercospora fuligena]|uniref:Phosphatidylethanolamine-binding protein 4 n=1 Tax=Pseudocercospora fuligena TaxID=685502 RepID=A0A8H6RQQ6_9PEZI|nr:Phosphatidylethanolamine-binding protein 4 [Pseudocercospora fuligena]
MKTSITTTLALAIAPALAIPPPDFGFPEAPNDTALTAVFTTTNGTVPVTEGALFGINIPEMAPALSVNTSAYRSLANYSGEYVVLMVDPDASYPEMPNNRFILHWMQANLTQSDNNPATLPLSTVGRQLENTSAPVVEYRRPSPPTKSSAHRYILYAFQQPMNFTIPEQWSGLSNSNRSRFNLTNFINDTMLGTPAAANFFYVSNQTSVPMNFNETSGNSYPDGDGTAVTSGDPYMPTGSTAGSSSSSSAGAAMITGVGSLVGAGLVGIAALM